MLPKIFRNRAHACIHVFIYSHTTVRNLRIAHSRYKLIKIWIWSVFSRLTQGAQIKTKLLKQCWCLVFIIVTVMGVLLLLRSPCILLYNADEVYINMRYCTVWCIEYHYGAFWAINERARRNRTSCLVSRCIRNLITIGPVVVEI